jgi:hypothetical protein
MKAVTNVLEHGGQSLNKEDFIQSVVGKNPEYRKAGESLWENFSNFVKNYPTIDSAFEVWNIVELPETDE